MTLDFNIYQCNYKDRSSTITKDSAGVVKCRKNFPVFTYNDKDYIFKPLSKTKPFITPLFAISEVFWSSVIKEYFNEFAPLYRLAICKGYEKEFISKYSKGTIVESIVSSNQSLVNLLEYYLSHPEEGVDIKGYINYCGVYYDYVKIFNSSLFKENNELGCELANQILISILKGDINYHYENVSFIYEKDKLKRISPPFDHEYSVPFMFPDNIFLFSTYFGDLTSAFMKGTTSDLTNSQAILRNIRLIAERYPDVVNDFLQRMSSFIKDFSQMEFTLPSSYLEPLSSNLYLVYEAIYQEHEDTKKIHEIPKFSLTTLEIEEYSKIIQRIILFHTTNYQKHLIRVLKK